MSTFIENYQRVLKDQGKPSGTQWVFYCPFPGCVNYTKRKFFVDPGKGYWCCKHCNHEVPNKTYRENGKEASGGTWQEFVLLMDDDPDLWPTGPVAVDPNFKVTPLTGKKRREVWTAMFKDWPLHNDHKEHLRSRGIDPDKTRMVTAFHTLVDKLLVEFEVDTLVRAGLIYRVNDPVLGEIVKPRTCIQDGRLLIPYFDEDGQVYYFVGYMKCPKRQPDQSIEDYQALKNDWKKIAGPAGYTPAIYGDIPEDCEYLLITEGQFKAEAACQRGFACIGLQGHSQSHASVVKKCVEKRVKRVIDLFDTQAEDQDDVDHSGEKLARELLKVGIPTYRARLPLFPDVDRGQKMDIDSFLVHFGLEEFYKILMAAQPYELQEIEETEANEQEAEATTSDGGSPEGVG